MNLSHLLDSSGSKEPVTSQILPCDPSKLINEIILSPFAPEWYLKLIEKILKRYSLLIKLKKSDINTLPLFLSKTVYPTK
jgi:hypothetical protein